MISIINNFENLLCAMQRTTSWNLHSNGERQKNKQIIE